jgi:DoxX-like family
VQLAPIKKILDDLGIPEDIRPVFPVVKGAAAVGLASVTRFPALARLTTAMLTLYFILAVGAHVRAHDKIVKIIPAASFLAVFAVMTAEGPDRN